jgi:hypothetical protein
MMMVGRREGKKVSNLVTKKFRTDGVGFPPMEKKATADDTVVKSHSHVAPAVETTPSPLSRRHQGQSNTD